MKLGDKVLVVGSLLFNDNPGQVVEVTKYHIKVRGSQGLGTYDIRINNIQCVEEEKQ